MSVVHTSIWGVSSQQLVCQNERQQMKKKKNMSAPDLVAKTGVAATDTLFADRAHSETHDAVKASSAAAVMITSASARANGAWRHAGRVVVKSKSK